MKKKKEGGDGADRLQALGNLLQRNFGKKDMPEEGLDVTSELVLGCMSAWTTESKARAVLSKLQSNYADYNELRVTRPVEAGEILGKDAGLFRMGLEQIITMLQGIFAEQDHLDLEHLRGLGKREGKVFLEGLPGSSSYVVARVMLRALGGHAIPVHEQMLRMLREEGVFDSGTDAAAAQAFLERQIPAKKALKIYNLLRRHADSFKGPLLGPKGSPKETKKTSGKKDKGEKRSRTKNEI